MTFKEYFISNKVDKNTNFLNLSNTNLTDINGIEEFTKIKMLYIRNNKIEDISVLSSLKELTHLYIDGNNITNINCLKNSNIEILSYDSNIIDKEVLLTLPFLHTIHSYNTHSYFEKISKDDLIKFKNKLIKERRNRLIKTL